MKKLIFITLIIAIVASTNVSAQTTTTTTTTTTTRRTSGGGNFGNTLNLGLGIGYYGYTNGYNNRSIPVFHINYELNVAKNFTLAPFISFYRLSNRYYWGNHNTPYRYYNYNETVIPIGLKGSYYFDDIVKANSDWDFYLAGSLGFAIVNQRWDDGYAGDKNYYRGANPLYLDVHLGTEYHFNNKVGVFLDLSTGVSTIGLAIH